jgi:hypothetical protein
VQEHLVQVRIDRADLAGETNACNL